MKSSVFSVRRTLIAALAACLLPLSAQAADPPKPSDKWRLQVDSSARSAGGAAFRISWEGATPIEVSATVPDNHAENSIARDLRDAFRAKLPPKQFKIEMDDGEDVLLKKRARQPDFVVEFVGSSVQNTQFILKRE